MRAASKHCSVYESCAGCTGAAGVVVVDEEEEGEEEEEEEEEEDDAGCLTIEFLGAKVIIPFDHACFTTFACSLSACEQRGW